MTSELSFCLTSAPMTPRDVNRKYSKGRFLLVVFRKGYKKSGICAANLSSNGKHAVYISIGN